MKTLKLKKLVEIDYKTNLMGILRTAPEGGYSHGEIFDSVKAQGALKEATEEVKFEDAVADFVKKRVENSKYVIATEELKEFLDDITNSL